jgi:hypothetical protein
MNPKQAKRARRNAQALPSESADAGPSCSKPAVSHGTLLCLPPEVLEKILCSLDSMSLVQLSQSCKVFRTKDRATGLRMVDKVARELVVAACGPELAQRFRYACS